MKNFLILLLFALTVLIPFASYAQTAADKPVDESNVIFAGCRLSNLQAAYPNSTTIGASEEQTLEDPEGIDIEELEEGDDTLTDEEIANEKEIITANANLDASEIKNKYIKGCIQEIIRFVIIIASLGAIISVAVAGVLQMTNQNAKPIKNNITNTIIGLFLLIVGWNLIPIFNNSFNNTNFLSLPEVNVCTQANYCTTEAQRQQRIHYNCMKTYKQIKLDKTYSQSEDLIKQREDCLVAFCKVKSQFPRINSSNCIDYTVPGSIVKKIKALIKEGDEERKKKIVAINTSKPAADSTCPEPEKAPKPLAVGIVFYKYNEANSSDLVAVEGAIRLHKDAANGYNEMKAAAAKEGVTLKLLSGYRSIAEQAGIVNKKRSSGESDVKIYKSSSEAGYSEHHTGMAMDLNSLNASFGNSKEGQWLAANVSKYGFEISYPRGNKENVTYEPWHIRYVKSDPKMFCYASKK